MRLPPAITIHGPAHARRALSPGLPVLLLSAPGAACFAGAAWWRALMAAHGGGAADALDCADAPGRALEALACGCNILVLLPCPGWATVAARAGGALLLAARPASLDLAQPGAERRVEAWLASPAG